MIPGDVVRRLLEIDEDGERLRFLHQSLVTDRADELLELLQAEAERYWKIDPHASLRLAEALVTVARMASRPGQLAVGLLAKANALLLQGRHPESLVYCEEAGRSFLEQRNEVGWARTRIPWLVSMHRSGRATEALAVVDHAREVLVRHHEWFRAAGLDLNTAVVCYELGRYDQALKLYGRAAQTYESLGPSAEIQTAWVRANQAMILALLGDFRNAIARHEEARQVCLRHGEIVSVLKQDQYIAQVYAGQGHYTRALRIYSDTLVELEKAGLGTDAAWVALNMVECYLSLNRAPEALELAQEAVDRFERSGALTEAAKARFYCALGHARLRDIELALALLADAGRTFASTGLVGQLAIATLERARLYLEDGDMLAALEEANQAYALFDERGLVVRQAQAEIIRAKAALGLGQYELATSLASSALKNTREREVLWLLHECHHVLADVARAQGDLERALDECQTAIASIERVQSPLPSELRSNFLADKLPIYQDAIDYSLRLGKPDLAFEYLERAKSRALVDYLIGNLDVRIRTRNGSGGANRELVEELTRLREEHNWFYERLYGYGLARRPEARHEDAEAQHLQSAIRDREKRIGRILERLALHDEASSDPVPSLHAEQRLERPDLDDGTVLLEYYFRPDGGAVFAVTRNGLDVIPLAARPDAIRRLMSSWQLNLDAAAAELAAAGRLASLGRNGRGILQALYRALLQPVAAHLASCERVVVIPYGPTHSVPFHALHDGQRYLVERVEVSVCPSSSLLRLCTTRPRHAERSALIVAHSDGGRLPNVLAEAQAVAALLPGECYLEEQATRAAVVGRAPHHAVLHLAAHGEARMDNPTFAHLRLADGQLSPTDVFNLELDGALVALSGCETGRALVTGGDEVIGLSRGFLYAGAATLVQSLWRVEDHSTARLMAQFYRGVSANRPAGAALREAQLALLADHGAHPYLWAPFQLIGDSTRRVESHPRVRAASAEMDR